MPSNPLEVDRQLRAKPRTPLPPPQTLPAASRTVVLPVRLDPLKWRAPLSSSAIFSNGGANAAETPNTSLELPTHFAATSTFQASMDPRILRFTEILDIVKRAWSEPRFSYA